MMICNEGRLCAICDDSCPSYIDVVPVKELKKTKEEISNLIYEYIDYMYCDNCRYNFEIPDTCNCDDCHRKYVNWAVSRYDCELLAERILSE